MFRTTLAAIAAVAAVTVPAVAMDEEFEFAFEFKPSEMKSAQSAEVAYERLNREAFRACLEAGRRITLEERGLARDCAEQLVAKTVSEANRPLLTAAHQSAVGETTRFAAAGFGSSLR